MKSSSSSEFSMNRVEELLQDLQAGRMVILVDDENRENEGDLVLAADHVTAEAVNFMATQARGLICLSLTSSQVEQLKLPLMVREDLNDSPNKTAFTVSIEASSGVTTGISAADRAHTIRVAANPSSQPTDVGSPGHIFPIRAQAGGVLKRAGHTEGSVDLCRLAGLTPAAVICEVMNEDGTMARVPDLIQFAQKHQLKIGTIVDLIQYRLQTETLVEEVHDQTLPPHFGEDWRVRLFRSQIDGFEHLVLQKGEIDPERPIMARVHVENSSKDIFSFLMSQENLLFQSLQKISEEGQGVVILIRSANKSSIAPEISTMENRTSEQWARGHFMDDRDYGIGAQILRQLGVQKIRLLSNRPDRRVGLKAFELEIVEIVPLDSLTSQKGITHEKKPTQEVESGSRHRSIQ